MTATTRPSSPALARPSKARRVELWTAPAPQAERPAATPTTGPLEATMTAPEAPQAPAASPAPEPARSALPRTAVRVLPVRQDRPPSISLEGLTDADAVLALDRAAVERLSLEATLRLGAAKRRRAKLLNASPADAAALVAVNGEMAYLGSLVSVLMGRRRTLRIRRRVELGQVPERCEAIALAVDSLIDGHLYRRIQAEADRLLKQAAADLEQGEQEGPPPPDHPLNPCPPPASDRDRAPSQRIGPTCSYSRR